MRKSYSTVTREHVSKQISYDPNTGEFFAVARRGSVSPGDRIDTLGSIADVCGISTTYARLAWLLHTGEWPKGKVNRVDASIGFRFDNLVDTGVNGPVKKRKPKLTLERLREVLRYCPATGIFTWQKTMSSTAKEGSEAGCIGPGGYVVIRIDGMSHLAHRLAIMYIYGQMPEIIVDHKNGIRSDNRLENIRAADYCQNAQNKRKAISSNKASGLLGVYWSNQHERWGAKVNLKGRQYHAGFWDTPEEAHLAYIEKKRQMHEFGML